VKILAIIAC